MQVLAESFKAMRPGHWAKNLLLAVPILLDHEAAGLDALLQLLVAAVSFSLVCSAGYLFNDIYDLRHDRENPSRQHRPLAAGRITVSQALATAVACVVVAAALGALVGPEFILYSGVYLALVAAYTLLLKKALLLDVFALAAFYSLRIFIGGVAVSLEISFWLLCFSVFFFTSLGFLKRHTAMHENDGEKPGSLSGRSYVGTDRHMCAAMGVASGFASILVYALYIDSEIIGERFSTPEVMWLQLPVLLYWINRMWLLAGRDRLRVDPVLFASRDKVSIACGFMCIGITLAANL